MPLYRTNSDRGLWKKYKPEQIQHFHKANYLNLDKKQPQVTYSQLDLGEGYRNNSRQSNPNIRADIEAANEKFSRSYGRTKSAPATPTRSRSRHRMNGQDGNSEGFPPPPSDIFRYDVQQAEQQRIQVNPSAAASNVAAHVRPTTSNSQYSQDTYFSGYPEDDGYSLESRSLAGYSGGRDSALDSYMSAGGYRNHPHHHPNEPIRRDFGRYGYINPPRHEVAADRPNPFVPGSDTVSEADNVVQMFLMNQANKQMAEMVARQQQMPCPGRVEDLPSPTGPVEDIQHEEYHDQDNLGGRNPSSRTVISKLRKQFLSQSPPKDTQEQQELESPNKEKPKNKYLKEEHRWSKPQPSGPINDMPNAQIDTVQGFVAPQMHHAEVVHLREDSSSEEDSDGRAEPPRHMVLQSPMAPMPDSVRGQQQQQQQQEQQYNSNLHHQGEIDYGDANGRRQSNTTSSASGEDPNRYQYGPDGDRSFQDPAYTSYQERSDQSKKKGFFSFFKKSKDSQKKGRGSRGKGKRNRPQSEYFPEDDNHEYGDTQWPHSNSQQDLQVPISSMTKSFTEGDSIATFDREPYKTRVPMALQPESGFGDKPNASMITHVNRSLHRRGSDGSINANDDFPPPQPLARKRSMSKPTDLDEILRLQQEEEERLKAQSQKDATDGDVFENDPWFRSQTVTRHTVFETKGTDVTVQRPNDPIYENTKPSYVPPSHDTTQEIDVDAALGYCDEEAIEQIVWPVPVVKDTTIPTVAPQPNPIEIQYDPMRNFQQKPKKKQNFFGFGSKKKDKKAQYDDPLYTSDGVMPPPLPPQVSVPQEPPPPVPEVPYPEEEVQMENEANSVPTTMGAEENYPHADQNDGLHEEHVDQYSPKEKTGFFKIGKKKMSPYRQEQQDYPMQTKIGDEVASPPAEENNMLQPESEYSPKEKTSLFKIGKKKTSPYRQEQQDHPAQTKMGDESAIPPVEQNDMLQPEPELAEDYSPKEKSSFFKFGKKKTSPFREQDHPEQMSHKRDGEENSPDADQKDSLQQDMGYHDDNSPKEKPSFFKFGKKKPSPYKDEPEEYMEETPVNVEQSEERPISRHSQKEKPLGPVREEKPKFFHFKGGKPAKGKKPKWEDRWAHNEPQIDTNGQGEVVDMVQEAQPEVNDDMVAEKAHTHTSHSTSSRDASPNRSKKTGIGGFFRSPGWKSNSGKKPRQIGDMPPVDVSHLVEDDFYDEDVQQSPPDTKGKEVPLTNDVNQPSQYVEAEIPKPTRPEPIQPIHEPKASKAPMQNPPQQPPEEEPHGSPDDDYVAGKENAEPTYPPEDTKERGRTRKKSGGSGLSGLFSIKPSSRANSQSRLKQPVDTNLEGEEDRRPSISSSRSKSLPRRRQETKGLSGFFGMKPSPSQELRRQRQMSREHLQQPPQEPLESVEHYEEDIQQPPRRRQPPPKSKSTGGLSGMFSMQPRHRPRPRPSGPPPPPPQQRPPPTQSEEPAGKQEQEERPNYNTSTASLPGSRQRRDSKGISGLLNNSPFRKSNRKPIPRSNTFPIPPASNTHPHQPHDQPDTQAPFDADQEEQRPQLPAPSNSHEHPPPHVNDPAMYDKIEVAPQQPAVPQEHRQSPIDPPERQHQQGRQMGRRSGRFRKQPGEVTSQPIHRVEAPSQQPHPVQSVPKTPTEQSVMQDMFVESVQRSSRRGSMSSLGHNLTDQQDETMPPDQEYDQAIDKGASSSALGGKPMMRMSTSSVGRTESYKQAKTTPLEDSQGGKPQSGGRRQRYSHNSLPRNVGGRRRQPEDIPQREPNDPDRHSLGGRPRSRQNNKVEDPCRVM